jgi:hypothetical protein
VLHLMGLPVPSDMDGRVLTEILTADSLQARAVEVSAPLSYWPDQAAAAFVQEPVTDEGEELVRDRLRALGYVE